MPHLALGDGTRLYYEARGAGLPLYLIHGGPTADHTVFGDGLDLLGRLRTLYLFDMRGRGQSSPGPPDSYTLERCADDLEEARRQLGHGRVDVLGHSMGAIVAQLFAARHGPFLQSLILCDGPISFGPLSLLRDRRAWRPALRMVFLLVRWRVGLLQPRDPAQRAEAEARQWHAFSERYYRARPIGRPPDALCQHDPACVDPLRRQAMTFDGRGILREVTVPVLGVAGAADRMFAGQLSVLRRVAPHARTVLVPDAGHSPWEENPGSLIEAVEAFLRDVDAG